MARNGKKKSHVPCEQRRKKARRNEKQVWGEKKNIFDNTKFANILPSNLFIPTFKSVKFDVFKTVVNHLYLNHLSVFFRENLI